MTAPSFRPDHNGECLHCDELLDAHGPAPDHECPAECYWCQTERKVNTHREQCPCSCHQQPVKGAADDRR